MKKLLFTAALGALISTSALAAPVQYTLDPTHTNIVWKADHFGFSKPSGKFTEVEGTLVLDEENPEASKVSVLIKPASVMTGVAKFDEHLKTPDFFNVLKYPEATFKSFKVEKTGDKTAKIHGDLTLLGITKRIVLDATLNKIDTNPFGKHVAGFTLSGTIKRSDFGMRYGLPGVSDEIPLDIEVEAIRNEE